MIVKLQHSGAFDENTVSTGDENKVIKRAMLVYEGKFESMDGPVEIKGEHIEKLASEHNSLLSKVKRFAKGEQIPARFMAPIQLDHSTSAKDTVGRLYGDLEVGSFETEEGPKKALFGQMCILGKENVDKVNDGRWTHLSIGADLETGKLSELTITPFPAAPDASMLSKGKQNLSKGEEDMPTFKELKVRLSLMEKCKKHLMDEKKMSEEDAEKELSGMNEEEMSKMASDVDEKEKKMAADKEEADKKLKEEEDKKKAEMSSGKEALVKLAKGFKTSKAKMELESKKASISSRLSALKGQAKITPAEIKKISIDELAAKTEEEINTALSTYEKREPVILTGLYGTTKAMTSVQLHKALKGSKQDMMRLQTMLNMPSMRKKAEAELAKLSEGMEKENNIHVDIVPNGEHDTEMAGFEECWSALKALTVQGKDDEAKEHLKKYMSGLMGKMGQADLPVGPQASMSALANELKTLQTEYEATMKLVGPKFGLTEADLA